MQLKKFLWGSVLLVFTFLFPLIFTGIPIMSNKEFYPQNGNWYCEELKLQLSFENPQDCFIYIENEKITCGCGSDKGSSWMSVGCQEYTSHFELGEEVFGGEFIKWEGNELVIFEPESKKEYTFIQVPNSD